MSAFARTRIAPLALYSLCTGGLVVMASCPEENKTFVSRVEDTSLFGRDKKSNRRSPSKEYTAFRKDAKRFQVEMDPNFKGPYRFAIGEVPEPCAVVPCNKGQWVDTHTLQPTGIIFKGTASAL